MYKVDYETKNGLKEVWVERENNIYIVYSRLFRHRKKPPIILHRSKDPVYLKWDGLPKSPPTITTIRPNMLQVCKSFVSNVLKVETVGIPVTAKLIKDVLAHGTFYKYIEYVPTRVSKGVLPFKPQAAQYLHDVIVEVINKARTDSNKAHEETKEARRLKLIEIYSSEDFEIDVEEHLMNSIVSQLM